MKNIPHDYYLRFLDSSVYDEVLSFHSRGNYTIHEAFQDVTCLHSIGEQQLSELTGNELKLYSGIGLTINLTRPDVEENSLYRNESCERFSSAGLDFSIVEKLVYPLVSKKNNSYKRGYPSGGALYPVEVFLCSLTEQNKNWPCPENILHLLPNSCEFEVMQIKNNMSDFKSSILKAPHDIGSPSLALIYVAYIPKCLFKYRYRGYRMALMEVGSIYMLVELQAKFLGLGCRLWSAYTDTMLCKCLGLNPAMFFPMCVHFIGEQHEAR